jgi:hypothetical protein
VSKLPKLSGDEVVKILVKNFGFEVARHKGNHINENFLFFFLIRINFPIYLSSLFLLS